MPGMNRKGGWNVPGATFDEREGTRPMTGGGRGVCRRTGDAAAQKRGMNQGGGRGPGICRGQGGGRGLGNPSMTGGTASGAAGLTPGGNAVGDGESSRQGEASRRALEAIMAAVRQLEDKNRKKEG